jgi:hypothetical protein
MCRQPQQRDAAVASRVLHCGHQLPSDPAAAGLRGDGDALHLGTVVCVGRAAEGELGHPDDLRLFFGDNQQTLTIVERRDGVAIRAFEGATAHRIECP